MSDLTSPPPHSPAPGPRAPTLPSVWGARAFKLVVVAAGVALGIACVALALFGRGLEHCRDDGRCVQVTFARGFPWVARAQAVTNAVANGPLIELDHGRPRTLGVYVAGRPEGCFFYWDDTGTLDHFGRFHEGRREGTWIVRTRPSAPGAAPAYEERVYRDDLELTAAELARGRDVPFDPCTPPGGDAWRASLARVSPERGALQVHGALTPAQVKLVVDERLADLSECRRHVPFPAIVDITIDANGRAESFAESAPCVRAAISAWRFPRASGGTAVRLEAAALVPAWSGEGAARIEVRASEEVTIFLDGKRVARGRAASLPVTPGEHKLRYERHAIGIDEERIVRVGPGEIADVDAYFAPIR